MYEKRKRLISRCKALPLIPTAVARPGDESLLTGVVDAPAEDLIMPVRAAPQARIPAAADAEVNLVAPNAGVLRCGFHGLSDEYIASILPRYGPVASWGRAVVPHRGNVDAIVFTGGIGENLALTCEPFISNASLLGVKVDGAANAAGVQFDAQPGCRVIAPDQRRTHGRQPCPERVALGA